MIPLFVMVYSFMILPCSYLLKQDIDRIRSEKAVAKKGNKYVYALLPLLGLLPYVVLVVLFLLA